MAVLVEGAAAELLETAVRARSPRIMASAIMTVLPPSMMFCVPTSVAFRATLLPVSVSMYSPLGARLDMVGRVLFDWVSALGWAGSFGCCVGRGGGRV